MVDVLSNELIMYAIGLSSIGAGLAIGAAALGSGIGQGIATASAAGVVGEKEETMGKMIVFAAIPETQAIYGLIVALFILFRVIFPLLTAAGVQ